MGKFQSPEYSILIGVKVQTERNMQKKETLYLLVYPSVESFFITLPPLNSKPCSQALCRCVAILYCPMVDGVWEQQGAIRASQHTPTVAHRQFLKKINKCAVFSGS